MDIFHLVLPDYTNQSHISQILIFEASHFSFLLRMLLFLSSAQRLPMDIPIKIAIIDKNSERVVDDGKRERRQLPLISPLPVIPRALSFFLSPVSLRHRGL